MDKTKFEKLSKQLEQLKAKKYDCPGPTREVSEEVKNALEVALNEDMSMTVLRCMELNCMACETYDEHADEVDQVEDQLDALYDEDGESAAPQA